MKNMKKDIEAKEKNKQTKGNTQTKKENMQP